MESNFQSISTVTPVYKGEKYLEILVGKLEKLRNEINRKSDLLKLTECIFVTDDCVDNSLEVLRRFSEKHDWLHIIELSKNYGQHPATIAGILHASGDWIITLDEDLQHDPDNILELLHKTVKDSNDICYAHSTERVHSSIIRDLISRQFKWLVSKLSGNPHVSKFSSFRCIRGPIARAAAATSGINTYYDVSLSWFSQRITTIKFKFKDQRNTNDKGQSGYSVWGLIKHAKMLILSSKLKFLRIITVLGLLSFSLSVFYSFYVLTRIFSDNSITIKGWPSTIISIYFFGGLTCLFLGIIIETLSDILLKSKGKPSYFVVNRSLDGVLTQILENEHLQNR